MIADSKINGIILEAGGYVMVVVPGKNYTHEDLGGINPCYEESDESTEQADQVEE